jgi:hypothetical protein
VEFRFIPVMADLASTDPKAFAERAFFAMCALRIDLSLAH